jgi:hypothetical protein
VGEGCEVDEGNDADRLAAFAALTNLLSRNM